MLQYKYFMMWVCLIDFVKKMKSLEYSSPWTEGGEKD